MITDKIKDEIQSSISVVFGKHIKIEEIFVEKPQNKAYGDFATNIAFKLAANEKMNPAEIAEKLAAQLHSSGVFKGVKAEGAFINFVLKRDFIGETVQEIIKEGKKFGGNSIFKGKKIQVEFISANPTGPLTLGNSRGGFPGDVLSNLFELSGANVTREYYFNNGGNQIKTLGESVLVSAGLLKLEGDYYKGEYIDKWVKEHSKEIKNYEKDPLKLGQIVSETIIEEYLKPTIEKMGIKFDFWFNEADLIKSGEVEKTIERLKEKKNIIEKDGAVWFRASDFGDEKDRVMVKSDGTYTYFAVDSAYHWNKFAVRKFDKVINIWGADHHGDMPRVLGVTEAFGFKGRLQILITQFVRLIKDNKEFKMSKRKGTYVTLDDLLDLIGGKTKEASDVARFFFLSRASSTHMDFNLDLAREHSEKNPVFYVKYAHARLCGILEKASGLKLPKADLSLLKDDSEFELAELLSTLPVLVQSIVTMKDYPVHLLTFYVRDLATAFHRFYDKCRVIDEDNLELTSARLELIRATQIVLKTVMEELIGIEAPEKM